MSQYNNYTPPSTTQRTTPTPAAPAPAAPARESVVETPVVTQQTSTNTGQVDAGDQDSRGSALRPNYITSNSVSEETNVSTKTLDSQLKSSFYVEVSRNTVSEESTTYFTFLESKGVVFTIFAEEEVYSKNFTKENGDRGSYPTSQTARYHFVDMLSSGKIIHGFESPLTNGNMRHAHPELTDTKIEAMRSAFAQNQNIRPFAYPVQVRNASAEDIEKLKQNEMELFSFVNAKKPLNVVSTASYERPNLTRGFSSKTNKGTVPFMSVQRPRAAENGDLWFDQKHGRLYVFMSLVSGSFWVEV